MHDIIWLKMIQLMTSRSNQENIECGSHVRLCTEVRKSPVSICVSLARTRLSGLSCTVCEWFLSFFPFPVTQGAALCFQLYNQDCLCRWDVKEQLSGPDSQAEYTPHWKQRSLRLNDLPGAHPLRRTKAPLGSQDRWEQSKGLSVQRGWGWHHPLTS